MAAVAQVQDLASRDPVSLKRLLVAFDFSSLASLALEFALDVAAKQGSEVTLLHVAVSETSLLQDRLKELVDMHRSRGVDMRAVTLQGADREAIASAVAELQPDVLYLGAYGSNSQPRDFLGSTAESLLRTLPCPVVVVGPKTVRHTPDSSRPGVILCPVDFPEDVQDRLKIIARFAKALGCEVHLVHAIDVHRESSRPHSATDTQFEFELLANHLVRGGVMAESRLLFGVPDVVITEEARELDAEYIVFGLHKAGCFSSYSDKSLVAKVIQNATCAVLTFPQVPPASATRWQDRLYTHPAPHTLEPPARACGYSFLYGH